LLATKGFEHDPPYAAIVMEYVDGATLKQRLAKERNRFFEPSQIRQWILQLVEGLIFLHRDAERIHRDVKPANVMVDQAGRAKLMDFGISEQVRHTISSHSRPVDLPASKSSSHTLAYASPQQVRGEPGTEWDDVYGLGALIYELLTGRPPFFRGDAVMVALQIQHQPPTSLAKRRRELFQEGVILATGAVPDERWEVLTAACLAKQPEDRPTLEEIDAVLRGGALPEVMSRLLVRKRRGGRWLVSTVALFAVVAMVWWWLPHEPLSELKIKEDQTNVAATDEWEPPEQVVKLLKAVPLVEPLVEFSTDDVAAFVKQYYEVCNVPGGAAERAAMLADRVKFFDKPGWQDRQAILAEDEGYQASWPQQFWKVGEVEVKQLDKGLWQAIAPFEFRLEDSFFRVSGRHQGSLKLVEGPLGLQIQEIQAKEITPGVRQLKQEGFRQFVADYLASCQVGERGVGSLGSTVKPWHYFSEVVTAYFTDVSPKTRRKEMTREDIQALETVAAEDSEQRDFSLAAGEPCVAVEIKPSSGKKADVLYEVSYSVRFRVVYKNGRPPSESAARPEYCRISFRSGKPLITEIGKR